MLQHCGAERAGQANFEFAKRERFIVTEDRIFLRKV